MGPTSISLVSDPLAVPVARQSTKHSIIYHYLLSGNPMRGHQQNANTNHNSKKTTLEDLHKKVNKILYKIFYLSPGKCVMI